MAIKKIATIALAVLAGFVIVSFNFFKLTVKYGAPVTTLSVPQDTATEVSYGKDAVTLILMDSSKIYCYEAGSVESGHEINRSEIQPLLAKHKSARDFFVTIKPTAKASYAAVTVVLEEMVHNDVKRYAAVQLSPAEEKFIATLK